MSAQQKTDARFDALEQKIDARFDAFERKIDAFGRRFTIAILGSNAAVLAAIVGAILTVHC